MLKFELTEFGKKYVGDIGDLISDIKYLTDENDPISLKQQLGEIVGWEVIDGDFTIINGELYKDGKFLRHALASAKSGNQTIYLYGYNLGAIVEEDGSFEVARMD